jgi:hypothetical protein
MVNIHLKLLYFAAEPVVNVTEGLLILGSEVLVFAKQVIPKQGIAKPNMMKQGVVNTICTVSGVLRLVRRNPLVLIRAGNC